jgi:hypothetical protein|eukprot:COSAG01_NODE_2448_length_7682_cov_10.409600_7_plen_121_part_00
MDAREGEQTWNAEYQLVNVTPSEASRSRCGVLIVPLSPAKPDLSLTLDGWLKPISTHTERGGMRTQEAADIGVWCGGRGAESNARDHTIREQNYEAGRLARWRGSTEKERRQHCHCKWYH